MSTKMIAQTAFDAIARDGASIDFARDRQPEPRGRVVGEEMQREHRRSDASTVREHAVEVGFGANPRLRRERGADRVGGEATGHRPGGSVRRVPDDGIRR